METDTAYFSKQTGVMPAFAPYYLSFGDPSTWGPGLGVVHTTPAIINGKLSIIFLMFKPAAVPGLPSTSPVPAKQVILQRQADGVFTDVTAQLLGSATTAHGFVLNSEPTGVTVAYLGGNANPAIIISQTNDDGRNNGSDVTGNLAISQIELAQADGTYQVFDLGGPQFSDQGAINIYPSPDGPIIILAGYRGDGSGLIRVFIPGEAVVYIQQARAFAYDAANNSISPLPDFVGNQAGFSVLDLHTVVMGVTFYRNSGGPGERSVWLLKQDADGNWGLAQLLDPFPDKHLVDNFVYFTGAVGSEFVVDDGGLSIVGEHQVVGTFHSRSSGVDQPVVMTTLAGSLIGAPRADGKYYLNDFPSYNHYLFWDLVDGQLVRSPLHLVDANTTVNNVGMQQIDILHNGLNDLVISNLNLTGRPDVYLNDGAGDLYHVPVSQFPDLNAGLASSIFVDLGDGTWGLLYQPNVTAYNYETASPVMFYGTQAITITQDVTIADRHGGTILVTWSGNDTISDNGASSAATHIDAGSGANTATYSGSMRDYAIGYAESGTLSVVAKPAAPVAVNDVLAHVQRLKFIDGFAFSGTSADFTVTANSNGTFTVTGVSITDSLPAQGRLQFSDFGIAYDLGGNAGTTVKLIGAVFGTAALSNKGYVGIGLQLLDGGMSYLQLAELALEAAGVSSHVAEVDLLWTNIYGIPPTNAQAAPYVSLLDTGALSSGQLAVLASDSLPNASYINLVGLQQSGIAFT